MKEFESMTNEIVSIIGIWEPKLSTLQEAILIKRMNDQNRTIKQILGHLIDSASNSIH
jgi:hypothetical protein